MLAIPNTHQSSCFCHHTTGKKFRLQHHRFRSINCLWYWFTASSTGNFLEINLRKKTFKLQGKHSFYDARACCTKEWKNSLCLLFVQCKLKNLRKNVALLQSDSKIFVVAVIFQLTPQDMSIHPSKFYVQYGITLFILPVCHRTLEALVTLKCLQVQHKPKMCLRSYPLNEQREPGFREEAEL